MHKHHSQAVCSCLQHADSCCGQLHMACVDAFVRCCTSTLPVAPEHRTAHIQLECSSQQVCSYAVPVQCIYGSVAVQLRSASAVQLRCSVVQVVAEQCSRCALQYSVLRCSTVYYGAVQCIAVQCITVQYGVSHGAVQCIYCAAQ